MTLDRDYKVTYDLFVIFVSRYCSRVAPIIFHPNRERARMDPGSFCSSILFPDVANKMPLDHKIKLVFPQTTVQR